MLKDIFGDLLTPYDLVAVAWFLGCWIGYFQFAVWRAHAVPSLQRTMDGIRREWTRQMLMRDNRMLDVNIVRNLTRSSQFFASTTLLILGALLALMGYVQKAVDVMAELPFAVKASVLVWELKILLLVAIFVYAFFKFSWSIRQFGYCSVLVGAAAKGPADPELHAGDAERLAQIVSFASGNFNYGLRSYYFGGAALCWFVHPGIMMAATVWVVWILYAREFGSKTLKVLASHDAARGK